MIRASLVLPVVLLSAALDVGGLIAQTSAFPTAASADASPSIQSRIWTAIGGAVLGAGVGYFASQVSKSDWDEGAGQRPANRPVWATVGGSVGFAVGFSFPLSGDRTSSTRPLPRVRSRAVITIDQIRGAAVTTAYEAVQMFHPEWLTVRQPDVIGQDRSETMRVYLDDFQLGGLNSLRDVSAHTVDAIRFVPTAVATTRWGVGHTYGAIQVITTGGGNPF